MLGLHQLAAPAALINCLQGRLKLPGSPASIDVSVCSMLLVLRRLCSLRVMTAPSIFSQQRAPCALLVLASIPASPLVACCSRLGMQWRCAGWGQTRGALGLLRCRCTAHCGGWGGHDGGATRCGRCSPCRQRCSPQPGQIAPGLFAGTIATDTAGGSEEPHGGKISGLSS